MAVQKYKTIIRQTRISVEILFALLFFNLIFQKRSLVREQLP